MFFSAGLCLKYWAPFVRVGILHACTDKMPKGLIFKLYIVYVWIYWTHVCVSQAAFLFLLFFFFFMHFGVMRLLFMYCSLNSNYKYWLFCSKQCISVLFMDPQIPLFSNFFIKNGSHSTIHTFKNYFATVFSVFNFQFQQNKFYPNKPLIMKACLSKGNFVQRVTHLRLFLNYWFSPVLRFLPDWTGAWID